MYIIQFGNVQIMWFKVYIIYARRSGDVRALNRFVTITLLWWWDAGWSKFLYKISNILLNIKILSITLITHYITYVYCSTRCFNILYMFLWLELFSLKICIMYILLWTALIAVGVAVSVLFSWFVHFIGSMTCYWFMKFLLQRLIFILFNIRVDMRSDILRYADLLYAFKGLETIMIYCCNLWYESVDCILL